MRSGDPIRLGCMEVGKQGLGSVSYTHLDVYKRQLVGSAISGSDTISLITVLPFQPMALRVLGVFVLTGFVIGAGGSVLALSLIHIWDSSIEYVVRVWCATGDYWTLYYDLLEQVKEAFDQNGIEMTYNHLNVHLVERKEEEQ